LINQSLSNAAVQRDQKVSENQ